MSKIEDNKIAKILYQGWRPVRSRRDIPKEGRYLVTRYWERTGNRKVVTAKVVKYKGRKHWVNDVDREDIGGHYPYENVIAWQDIPFPYNE